MCSADGRQHIFSWLTGSMTAGKAVIVTTNDTL
jgi:hypothetical protein